MTDRITRRELLRRSAAGGALLSFPSLLAACGGDGELGAKETTGEAAAPKDRSLSATLRFSNWPEYIDVDDKGNSPTLRQFERKYNVKVKYIEDINDNDQFFGKIQGPLNQGQSIDRDLMVLTDSTAARVKALDWLEKLDKSAIPNIANLQDAL